MSEVYVDEEIINFLFEQLKISLKDKYDIDLDLNRVYEYEVDKMIKEIEKSIGG